MVTTKKVAAPSSEPAAKRVTKKPAQAKPVKLQPVVAKPVAAKVAAKVATKKKAPALKPAMSAAQRNNYVEVAAFYIAERRGFAAANPADDWAAAEAEIDRLIASGHFTG